MHSALYVGRVRHRRHHPKPHRLQYRVWHLAIDLDELERLDREVRGFGHNRRGLVEFRDTDHFVDAPGGFAGFGGRRRTPDEHRPVRDRLRDLLAARGIALPDGRITVLTHPRVLGFVFNPVSFWYCHDADGRLALVVAEVNNTFGDQWSYLLDDLETIPGEGVSARATKVLHVSPFLPVEGHEYAFTIRPPIPVEGSRQTVHMDVLEPDDSRVLDATLTEQRRELTTRNLLVVLATHPLVTLHTVVAIHWQALRIWVRGKARFHRRPAPPTVPASAPNHGHLAGATTPGEPTTAPTATEAAATMTTGSRVA